MTESAPAWEWLPVEPQLPVGAVAAAGFAATSWEQIHGIFDAAAAVAEVPPPARDWIHFDAGPIGLKLLKGYGGGRMRNKTLLVRCTEPEQLGPFMRIVASAQALQPSQSEIVFSPGAQFDTAVATFRFEVLQPQGADLRPDSDALRVLGWRCPEKNAGYRAVFEPPNLFSLMFGSDDDTISDAQAARIGAMLSECATAATKPLSMSRWPNDG